MQCVWAQSSYSFSSQQRWQCGFMSCVQGNPATWTLPTCLQVGERAKGISWIGKKCLIITERSSKGRKYARIKLELRGSGKSWHGRKWWDSMVILLLPLPSGGHNYTHRSYTQFAVPVWCWTSGPGLLYHPKVLLIQGGCPSGGHPEGLWSCLGVPRARDYFPAGLRECLGRY